MRHLWVEKYRPKNITEYVFRDKRLKDQVEHWIKDGVLPNLLFAGPAGTGKTSVSKMLMRELGIDPGDVLEINASSEGRIADIRFTAQFFQ